MKEKNQKSTLAWIMEFAGTHKSKYVLSIISATCGVVCGIAGKDLYELVTLKRVSDALMKRIKSNYRFIVGFNTGLIGLGVMGVIQPTTSALLHNTSTLALGVKNMENLIE